MVKKLQKIAEKKSAGSGAAGVGQLLDGQFASMVKDSAQQIWQAGLGAFAKAQGEGGKVFESLVKEGMSIQRKTQAVAEEKLSEMSGRMTKLSDEVQSKAGKHWDKLETIFEDRVAKALGKLGVPSRQEMDALAARIDALTAGGTAAKAPRKTAARKAAAPSKAAPKRAAAKRSAAGKSAA